MLAPERELQIKWWSEAWTEGLWAASWSKSVEGLTAAQANWSPAPGRTSIWQVVLHIVFWRENSLRTVASATRGQRPTTEEMERFNFPAISDASESAWQAARARLEDTQNRVAAVLADSSIDVARLPYLIPHDSYHFGQINYLRAMQGLKPIE